MSLGVYWGGKLVGCLERVGESSREYVFEYVEDAPAISVSLPVEQKSFSPAESRPFFEALLPEGAVRDQIASQLRLASSDSYGLLAELGRDCAGALQILETKRLSDPPDVRWLDSGQLDALIEDLPRRPLGVRREDGRLRLSLAGVQRKAVLVRDRDGRFGEPLSGMPSTHILKPDLGGEDYPGLAVNEYFCMRLAAKCGLEVAQVELITAAGRPCVVVERFDRDLSTRPARRLHQEDLCQALGLTPDFKYQQPGWARPSYAALGDLLQEHAERPGIERLKAARATVFNFLIANADAHAKNISLLYGPGIRLAPLYDCVCTGAYAVLSSELAMGIGDEWYPARIQLEHWSDLAHDLRLRPQAFEKVRAELAEAAVIEAEGLRESAREAGWYDEVIDRIVELVCARSEQVR